LGLHSKYQREKDFQFNPVSGDKSHIQNSVDHFCKEPTECIDWSYKSRSQLTSDRKKERTLIKYVQKL